MLVGKDCDCSGGSLGRYGRDGVTGSLQFIYENRVSRPPWLGLGLEGFLAAAVSALANKLFQSWLY